MTNSRKNKIYIGLIGIAIIFMMLIIDRNILAKERYNSEYKKVEVEDDFFGGQDREDKNGLESRIRESSRTNVLILGLDGARSDTMMIASIENEGNGLDIIAIPRDTYYPRKGFYGVGMKKVNAIYQDSGYRGVYDAIEDITGGLIIDHYIVLNYRVVEKVVDSVGGVPVNIPRRMVYNDYYSNPPLRIRFEAGEHILNGEDSVKFLRYRQADKGSGALQRNGDIGRIEAQQNFIKSALERVRGIRDVSKIANIVKAVIKDIKTDLSVYKAIKLVSIGIKVENNVKFHILPGSTQTKSDGLSYFVHNSEETIELISLIMGD